MESYSTTISRSDRSLSAELEVAPEFYSSKTFYVPPLLYFAPSPVFSPMLDDKLL